MLAENIASESPENRRFRLPHCRLMPAVQETPANIRINPTLPEIIESSLIMSVYFHSNFRGGLRKTHVF